MAKLGFSLQPQHANTQTIKLLHDAGFSAISPTWSPDLPLESLTRDANDHNMTIQSLHAPYGGIAQLWKSGDPISANTLKSLTACIDDCSRFQIPIAVVHSWYGFHYHFTKESLYFSNFDSIVDYAEQKHISIAFENLEGEEYLEALMTHYQDRPYVGFCWDSGHEHCYPHKQDYLAAFGSRLIMTHLHDNLGTRDPNGIPTGNDDLHFLPFDGNICWEDNIARLKNLPKQDILNFELKMRAASTAPEDLIYDGLSLEAYIHMAGQRARQIADLYEKTMA